jgi:hypothetical protein
MVDESGTPNTISGWLSGTFADEIASRRLSISVPLE